MNLLTTEATEITHSTSSGGGGTGSLAGTLSHLHRWPLQQNVPCTSIRETRPHTSHVTPHMPRPHTSHVTHVESAAGRSERGELHGSAPQRYVAGRQRQAHGERPGLAPLVEHCLCDSPGCQLLILIGVSNLYPMESILHLWIGLELIWNDLSMVFSATAHNR